MPLTGQGVTVTQPWGHILLLSNCSTAGAAQHIWPPLAEQASSGVLGFPPLGGTEG